MHEAMSKHNNMIKTAIIATVRASIDDLRLYVHYQLNTGVDEIILLFDDPLDEGVDAFTQYSNVTSIASLASNWNTNRDDLIMLEHGKPLMLTMAPKWQPKNSATGSYISITMSYSIRLSI